MGDLTVDTGLDFLRGYDPTVTYWSLTDTGTNRVVNETFPMGIGVKGPGILRILHKLSVVEEDELGGFIGLSASSIKAQMKRLGGFGLVQQVT